MKHPNRILGGHREKSIPVKRYGLPKGYLKDGGPLDTSPTGALRNTYQKYKTEQTALKKYAPDGFPNTFKATGEASNEISDVISSMFLPIPPVGKMVGEASQAVKSAYKAHIQPFKPNPNMMYRGIGKEGYKDALEQGVFRAKQSKPSFVGTKVGNSNNYEQIDISKKFKNAYYAPSSDFDIVKYYADDYIAEVPKTASTFRNRYNSSKHWSQIAETDIPINKGKIYKKHWLKGYKEVPKPNYVEQYHPLPGAPEVQPNKWLNTTDNFGMMEAGKSGLGRPTTQEDIMESFKHKHGGQMKKKKFKNNYSGYNFQQIRDVPQFGFGGTLGGILKVASPFASLIPGVGPVASLALSQAGNMLGDQLQGMDQQGQQNQMMQQSLDQRNKMIASQNNGVYAMGGSIKKVGGGVVQDEGQGIESAYGAPHELGGMSYSPQAEIQGGEKVLDQEYVLTDEPKTDGTLSIAKRFDKNIKSPIKSEGQEKISKFTEYQKQKSINKNEMYLASQREAFNRGYNKLMKKFGGSIFSQSFRTEPTPNDLGYKKGGILPGYKYKWGGGGIDDENPYDFTSLQGQPTNLYPQMTPNNYSGNHFMGDPYNNAMKSVQGTGIKPPMRDPSTPRMATPNLDGYNNPERNPNSFDWRNLGQKGLENTQNLYNLGMGLFSHTSKVNPQDYMVNDQNNWDTQTDDATLRKNNINYRTAQYNMKNSGQSRLAGQVGLFNAKNEADDASIERINNINKQGRFTARTQNIENKFKNKQTALGIRDYNDRAAAAHNKYFSDFAKGVSDYAQGRNRDMTAIGAAYNTFEDPEYQKYLEDRYTQLQRYKKTKG